MGLLLRMDTSERTKNVCDDLCFFKVEQKFQSKCRWRNILKRQHFDQVHSFLIRTVRNAVVLSLSFLVLRSERPWKETVEWPHKAQITILA